MNLIPIAVIIVLLCISWYFGFPEFLYGPIKGDLSSLIPAFAVSFFSVLIFNKVKQHLDTKRGMAVVVIFQVSLTMLILTFFKYLAKM